MRRFQKQENSKFLNMSIHNATMLKGTDIVAFSEQLTFDNDFEYGKTETFRIFIKKGDCIIDAFDNKTIYSEDVVLTFGRNGFEGEEAREKVIDNFLKIIL